MSAWIKRVSLAFLIFGLLAAAYALYMRVPVDRSGYFESLQGRTDRLLVCSRDPNSPPLVLTERGDIHELLEAVRVQPEPRSAGYHMGWAPSVWLECRRGNEILELIEFLPDGRLRCSRAGYATLTLLPENRLLLEAMLKKRGFVVKELGDVTACLQGK